MPRKTAWMAGVLLPVTVVAMLSMFGSLAGGGDAQDHLVYIPGGKVRLGSNAREKAFGYSIGGAAARRWKWYDRERERVVTLAPFYIDRVLVTNFAYAKFVRATGHRAPFISGADYRSQGFLVHPYTSVRPFLWGGNWPLGDTLFHPVVLVSAPDAGAYCAWKGRERGRACRLPSEDQWELAARGAGGRYFPWGNGWRPRLANTAEQGPYRTTPVEAYPQGRSPQGLFDMAGNVFQWTSTPGRPGYRMLKGCSWDDQGGICRAAARHDRKAGSRHILIGFRCACEISPTGR